MSAKSATILSGETETMSKLPGQTADTATIGGAIPLVVLLGLGQADATKEVGKAGIGVQRVESWFNS